MVTCDCEDYELFMCYDCTVCTNCLGEYYMVNDDLWEVATEDAGPEILLCIGCLENRLGGLLTKDDFTAAPVNDLWGQVGSARLQARLQNVTASAIV